jgi:hypothetical protein
MNLYLIVFIVLAVATIIGGSSQLYSMSQTYGAVLFFIGSLTLFIIYGLRWFGASPLFTPNPGSWPPIINTCPDYLTYYKRNVGGVDKDTCIDMIGVSKDQTLLRPFPKDGSVPDSDDYYFDISGFSSDAATKSNQMCQAALAKKLTWEGVTNGESCVTAAQPSGGSGGAGGTGGSGGCPAV